MRPFVTLKIANDPKESCHERRRCRGSCVFRRPGKRDCGRVAAFLDSACADDVELRRQVEKLLLAHPRIGDFLNKPVGEQLAAAPEGVRCHAGGIDSSTAPQGGLADGNRPAEGAGTDDDEPLTFLAPPTRPDSLGRIGHYEVLQVLGQGGFGIVFRAFDEMLQRVVAFKVMAPQLAATSPARKRFLREARSSAQVRHENVVQVYEVAEQPLPYLVMEFIPGETLQQKLDRVGPLDVPEVLRIGRQIAEGLAAAHASDLIHRDIKPGNVLLEGGSAQGRRSPTSAWPARPTTPASRRAASSPARRCTWPPSRPRGKRSTSGPTCSASAACSTRW